MVIYISYINWKWFIIIFLFVPRGIEKDKLSFGVTDLEKYILKIVKCWDMCLIYVSTVEEFCIRAKLDKRETY